MNNYNNIIMIACSVISKHDTTIVRFTADKIRSPSFMNLALLCAVVEIKINDHITSQHQKSHGTGISATPILLVLVYNHLFLQCIACCCLLLLAVAYSCLLLLTAACWYLLFAFAKCC